MTSVPNPLDRLSGRHVLIALAAALAIVSAVYLLRPIKDPDFFWHLKSGEWILEHRRLPTSDPFSYTAYPMETMLRHFTLTSYWASQVLFAGAHAAGAWSGVVLLRVALAAALFAVVWRRRQGDAVVDAGLLLVFAVEFLEGFPVERPQVLSFLCFGLLLLMLEQLREEGRPSLLRGPRGPILVALLMLFWANAHAGFVLGQGTILVYLAAEGAKFAHAALRPIGRRAYRGLLVAGAAGLAASFLNPNTYHGLEVALLITEPPPGSHGLLKIMEYLSIPQALAVNRDYIRIVDLALMAVVAAAILSGPRRLDLTQALLAAGTGYFAFKHTRYVPVFMIAALPLAGSFLSRGPWVRWARPAAIAVAIALVAVFAGDERHGLARLRTGEWIDPVEFPVKAADFIIARDLRGNMYNHYPWGGYLLWRLAPERPVFVDGRNINPDVFWESTVIDNDLRLPGTPQWRALLDKYDIAYAVVPLQLQQAQTPLVGNLAADPEWAALFIADNSVIFARRRANGTP